MGTLPGLTMFFLLLLIFLALDISINVRRLIRIMKETSK